VFGYSEGRWGAHAQYLKIPEDGPIATGAEVVHLVGLDGVEHLEHAPKINERHGPRAHPFTEAQRRQTVERCPVGVPGGPVDLVSLGQQECGEIRAVLPADSGDQCNFAL